MLAKVREQVPQMGWTGQEPRYHRVPLLHRARPQTRNRPQNVHPHLYCGLLLSRVSHELDASTFERLPVGTPEWLKVSSPVAE